MKITQKILIGLGVVALTTGSLIVTPAKAQACDISCEIELSLRANGQTTLGTPLQTPRQTPAAVGGAPVEGGKVSFLVEYYADQAKCLAEGRCVARKVVYTPNQKAWMTCKEVYKFQDAHRICGGFPIR